MVGLSEQTLARDGNCIVSESKSFNRQLQFLAKLRVKEVDLFHLFLTITINR
jgi:hypothetical protein